MADKKSTKAPRRRGRKGVGKNGKKQHDQKRKNESVSHVPANKKGLLLIQLTDDAPTWYSCGRQTPGRDDTTSSHPPASRGTKSNSQLVSTFRAQADELKSEKFKSLAITQTALPRVVMNNGWRIP